MESNLKNDDKIWKAISQNMESNLRMSEIRGKQSQKYGKQSQKNSESHTTSVSSVLI